MIPRRCFVPALRVAVSALVFVCFLAISCKLAALGGISRELQPPRRSLARLLTTNAYVGVASRLLGQDADDEDSQEKATPQPVISGPTLGGDSARDVKAATDDANTKTSSPKSAAHNTASTKPARSFDFDLDVSFKLPSSLSGVSEWRTGAHIWAMHQLPALREGSSGALEVLRSSDLWLEPCVKYTADAWKSAGAMSARFGEIFGTIEPLRPGLSSSDTALALLADRVALRRLIAAVELLLDTSQVLSGLGQAIAAALSIITEVPKLIATQLSTSHANSTERVGKPRRFVFDVSSLLGGLQLEHTLSRVQKLVDVATSHSKAFNVVKSQLTPLMKQFEGEGSDATGLEGEDAGEEAALERSEKRSVKEGVVRNRAQYNAVLQTILDKWAKMEQLAIAICPDIASAHTSTVALRCRIESFVEVGSQGNSVQDLVFDACSPDRSVSSAAECPARRLSRQVKGGVQGAASLFSVGGFVLSAAALCGCGALMASAMSTARNAKPRGRNDSDLPLVDTVDEDE